MAEKDPTRRRLLGAIAGTALGATAGCVGVLGDGGGSESPGGDGGSTATGEPGNGGGDGASGSEGTDGGDPGPLALRTVATGFSAPLDLAVAPGSDPTYVADQTGVVSAVGPDGTVEPFLDLTDRIDTGGNEMGLLGLALHPDYAENRRFYVRYSSPRLAGTPASFSHTFVLSEFEADAEGRTADPSSERRLLTIPEPQSNHNAGSVLFGPDGYLYVGVGDGGGGGDDGTGHVDDWYDANDGGNGQDVTENLLGSILRIDVDERSSSASQTESEAVDGGDSDRPYGIPEDNPLVGEAGLDEHWAWGFRNPWRMSFDGDTLYVGDVGESAYEEVDRVRKGGNYGWNVREGTHCYGADDCPGETPEGAPLIDPVIEYPHSGAPVSGVSVIAGYVYRGDGLPGLTGRYVFGDLATEGRLFVATPGEGDGLWPTRTANIAEGDRGKLQQLLSFGRDEAGRLYALGRGGGDGGVYELRPDE